MLEPDADVCCGSGCGTGGCCGGVDSNIGHWSKQLALALSFFSAGCVVSWWLTTRNNQRGAQMVSSRHDSSKKNRRAGALRRSKSPGVKQSMTGRNEVHDREQCDHNFVRAARQASCAECPVADDNPVSWRQVFNPSSSRAMGGRAAGGVDYTCEIHEQHLNNLAQAGCFC